MRAARGERERAGLQRPTQAGSQQAIPGTAFCLTSRVAVGPELPPWG